MDDSAGQLILHSLWPFTADWLPAGVLASLVGGGSDSRSYIAALALAALYAVAAYVASSTVFERRDIID